jgi:hypothetical protein
MTIDLEVNESYAPFFAAEAKESAILEALELYQIAFGLVMHNKGCKRKFFKILKDRGIHKSAKRIIERGGNLA